MVGQAANNEYIYFNEVKLGTGISKIRLRYLSLTTDSNVTYAKQINLGYIIIK